MEDLSRVLFDDNPDAVIITQADGSILAANPAACRIFASAQATLCRCELVDLLGLDAPDLSAALAAGTGGTPYAGELTFKRADGSQFSASVTAAAYSSGKTVLFIRDITASKQAQAELVQSEERLHQLAAGLRVGVWIREASTRKVLYVNPAFEEIFQLPRSVFYDDPEIIIKCMHPEDRMWFQEGRLEFSVEFRIVRPDGSIRWVWGRKFPVRNEAGEIYRTASIMEDITDRKETEEKLNQAYAELQRQIEEIQGLHIILRDQAVRDPLTGLFNRRYLDEILEHELDQARQAGSVVSLIMIDIDDFKQVNDDFGHACGDQVLQKLARLLRERFRSRDIACRYAGDEFMILLPDAPVTVAFQRAEMLRSAFRSEVIACSGAHIRSTLSIGIAQFPTHGATGREILATVDNAMYDAKARGKNCVVIWHARQAVA